MVKSRSGRAWRRPALFGLSVLSCGLLAACGGSSPTVPTPVAPGPTPTTPTPAPEPAGFLHLQQGSSVITYAIDGATGRLRESTRQGLGDASLMVGEPQGRYVFAAYDDPGQIVAYAPDPSSGSLMARSVAEAGTNWTSLSASSTRLYATLYYFSGAHFYPSYVSYAVESEGQLGLPSVEYFEFDTVPSVAVDVDSDPAVLYKSTETGGLTAHVVDPDGTLTQMGGSHLCLASSMDYAEPLVAARGFLLASAHLPASQPYGPSTESVCSWEGPRLAPRANLGVDADYAVALTPRRGSSVSSSAVGPATLVAMRTWYSVGHGLHPEKKPQVGLFAMSDDGDLEPLDTVESECAMRMLFHPSGRFLYVSHSGNCWPDLPGWRRLPESLSLYSIDAQGHLGLVETLEGAGGLMAITTPAVAASTPGR